MKFLKKFLTESAKSGYAVTDEMVSYVVESDNVYTTSLKKIASYTLHLSAATSSFAVYTCQYDSLKPSDGSSVDKITIDGQSIDLSKLSISDNDYTSDFSPVAKYTPSEPFAAGDYTIVLYTFDNNVKFSHSYGLKNDIYLHYTLSKDIKTIGSWAFGGKLGDWFSSFTEIWYEGTIAAFNALPKQANWKGAVLTTVHCTNGDITL